VEIGGCRKLGSRFQVPGCRLQVPGSRLQVADSRFQVAGFRLQVPGSRLQVVRSLSNSHPPVGGQVSTEFHRFFPCPVHRAPCH